VGGAEKAASAEDIHDEPAPGAMTTCVNPMILRDSRG